MTDSKFSRIDHFRQIKKEIRGSSDYLIVGIDIAKNTHYAFLGDANGHTILKKVPFSNTKEGFKKLITHVEGKKTLLKLSKVVFGLEPTASYHKALGEFLVKSGYSTVLVGTGAVKHNRELLDGRWDKNDVKDASNVADLISQGKCMYYDAPSDKIKQLRSLSSLKRKIKKQEHSVRTRLRNHIVAQFFPELDPYFDSYESGCLSVIEQCFDPRAIASMELMEFIFLVTPRKPTIIQEKKLKGIWEVAKESIGMEIDAAIEYEASMLAENLRDIRNRIKEIDKRVKKLCLTIPEYQYLISIPGFGVTIASVVLAAIGDCTRFQNARQVLKLVGLDLSASRSGKTAQSAVPRISKKGKSEIRYALYQAALIASSRNVDFIAYYTDKIKHRINERGIKTKMRVKLSAKMIIIAWTLMKKKEMFDPSFLRKKE